MFDVTALVEFLKSPPSNVDIRLLKKTIAIACLDLLVRDYRRLTLDVTAQTRKSYEFFSWNLVSSTTTVVFSTYIGGNISMSPRGTFST